VPHKPSDLQKAIESAAPPDLELRFRPMFGGIGVYAGGRMFCSLSDVGLALKLAGADHEELLKMRGAKALQYEPSMPPSKTYVVVPVAMLGDRKALCAWVSRSAAAARLAPARKPRKRPARRPGR
jgi:TfoX/Sxy family transcriptional regulator of competence genes